MPTIGTLLRRSARAYGARTAVVCQDDARTFEQIDAASDRVAAALLGEGVGAGARVAMVWDNSIEFVENAFGILKAGAAEVLVSPRLTEAEQVRLISNADPAVVFVGPQQLERAEAFAGIGSVRRVVVGGDDFQRWLPSKVSPPETTIDETAVWRLHYSSGTTGAPKAAVLTHRNFRLSAASFLSAVGGVGRDDVLLDPASLVTAGGWALWPHYLRGATSIVMPRYSAEAFIEEALKHRVTTALMVPTMISDLVDAVEQSSPLGDLRTVLYTAAPISLPRLDAALDRFGEVFVQAYAMSETMTALSVLDREDHREEFGSRRRSAGRPPLDVDIKIVDEDGNSVPDGDVGRVVVRSDAAMQGYWRDAERTAQTLRDGWLYSSDAGRIDEAGYLYVVDRMDDIIVSGGYNLYPLEIEDAIARDPRVAEVAVIGTPDDRLGEVVTAVVVPRSGQDLTANDVLASCAEDLARYKQPRRVEIRHDPLPKSPAGKVLRRTIRDSYQTGESPERAKERV